MKARSLVLSFLTLTVLALVLTGCPPPPYPKCENDKHCVDGSGGKREFCIQGLCQQCRTVSDCSACEQCAAGKCQAIPGCCQSTADCSASEKCRDGRCGPMCLGNDECEGKQACQGGRCVPVACLSEGDCAGGKRCVNYACVAPAAPACSVDMIHFDFDSYRLTGTAQSILDANVSCMKERGVTSVRVGGHCDARGTEEYNLSLGQNRANAAKTYLQRRGIGNVKAISYGENRPLNSRSNWDENRRAEFDTE